MLKFPRSLDEIDPIPPELGTADRWLEEWERDIEKEDGTDWKKIPGRPHWFRNGKGQLRYAPPLPSNPPKQAKPVPYSWVGRHLPKVGDRIKRDGWLNYYPVVTESDIHVVLFDSNAGVRWHYSKDLPWLFEN